ncbi:DUF6415 family natural product biosynthesis protein [Streptomyces zinciresistens]|nr:DUF6415 family natural product biosynthesis protein [Streptomyces zinciresistens]
MRAAAAWFLDQRTLPRHENLRLWSADLTAFLEHLIHETGLLAAGLPPYDVPGRVAMVCVDEARLRLSMPEAAGLNGETQRVRCLARSVVALCDHYDTLTGARMCLACDKPLDDGRPVVPYETEGPSGGAKASGRIHAACVGTGRPRR